MASGDSARALGVARSRIPWDAIRNNWAVIAIIAFLLFLILVPITRLLINSFLLGHPSVPEGWTLQNYTAAFSMPIFIRRW